MEQAQKPDFVFQRNGRVHLNRWGHQFSRLLAAGVCASALIVGSNAGYTMFRGSEKGTGYPLHSPVSPSLPLPCVTVCHHVSTGVYQELAVRCVKERSIRASRHVLLHCPAPRFLEHTQPTVFLSRSVRCDLFQLAEVSLIWARSSGRRKYGVSRHNVDSWYAADSC